ncbi:MAG: DEAD/DEAH box helicase family protein [Bdellovibrionales bacterium]
MTKAIMKSPRFDLSSYDRFFPNQDYMPKGGFGNLIALPLQKVPRDNENSIFISDDLKAIEDQWEHLSSVRILSYLDVSKLVDLVSSSFDKPDVAVEDENQSWSESSLDILTEEIKDQCVGQKIEARLSSQLYINIESMPSKLVAALKRLATFANPEFFQKQKMRFSTWNIPKYIFCGNLEGSNLILPSGLVEKVEETCEDAGAEFELADNREIHKKFRVSFKGKLKKEQKRAVEEVIQHECGVLVAPPGSGKTVMGCAILSKRKVPTLILVHRAPLLEQWKERISEFVNFDTKKIGTMNGQKKKPQGKIDVAMMQTINKLKDKDLKIFLDKYEQIIVDECHHIAAFTFESILKKSPARYILGLTATPYRKDGHQAIIHMQSGPVRYEMIAQDSEFESKRVIVRNSNFKMPEEAGPQPPIHQVWSHLITDEERLELVADDVIDNLDEARVPLVISERKEHLQLLRKNLLGKEVPETHLFILDGNLSKKQRGLMLEEIHSSLDSKKPVCILTTGSLIGEGFDLPVLDTLFLAMPVAFRGKVIQYAGRIHRPVEGKDEIRIYDYVDPWSGLTLSMFRKRVKAYRSMGYRIESPPTINVYGGRSQPGLFN